MTGPIVVAGATGFVGGHLVERLVAEGAEVRCGTRDVARAARARPDRTWVHLDVDDPGSLERALAGATTLVYLVHRMRGHGDDLLGAEVASARRALEAAERAGITRIVYLGGPDSPEPSPHLRARLLTGGTLRSGRVPTVELRAGMIVGVGSESWTIVRDLALRLPAMLLPRWLRNRSQPIYVDDVVAALRHAVEMPLTGSVWYDLPGPETLTAEEILLRIAAAEGTRPVRVSLPVLTPSLSSHWIRLVTRADYEVARQLVDGLTCDLVAPDDGFWALVPHLHRTPFDTGVRRTLDAETPASLSLLARAWEAWVRAAGRRAAQTPLRPLLRSLTR